MVHHGLLWVVIQFKETLFRKIEILLIKLAEKSFSLIITIKKLSLPLRGDLEGCLKVHKNPLWSPSIGKKYFIPFNRWRAEVHATVFHESPAYHYKQ